MQAQQHQALGHSSTQPWHPPRRTFDPTSSIRYGWKTKPPHKLVRYSPKYDYSRLFNFPYRAAPFVPRMNTIVIQIHGQASPNNASDPHSIATAGVFFGKGSSRNISFQLPGQLPQTNSSAVLEAVRTAINEVIAMRCTTLDPRWKEVIIMTNSEYAINSLSQWVWTWEKNNWTHIGRTQGILHLSTMRDLQNLLTYVETSLNMAVRFWKVERDQLHGAARLAEWAKQHMK